MSTLNSLIQSLKANGYLKSSVVEDAMRKIDRKFYAPSYPYVDSPQSIGYNATISAPHMHAFCLELMKDHILKPNSRVLDVGSGSGYIVACVGQMMSNANNNGKVFGIEHIPELVDLSIKNINKDQPQLLESGIASIQEGDGYMGLESESPFDCIHVGAASPTLPEKLVDQLNLGGIMIIPLGVKGNQSLALVSKDENGQIKTENVLGVQYVPLTSKEKQLKH